MKKTNKLFITTLVFAIALTLIGQVSSAKAIAVMSPKDISISPTSGVVGTTVTISILDNTNNATYMAGTSVIWLSNGQYSAKLSPVTSDPSKVTVKIPGRVCPGNETETCSSNFSTATGQYSYSIYIVNPNSVTNQENFTVTGPADTTPQHPEGSNINAPDGTVYRIVGNGRQPYTSAGAFLSYKFNSWSTTFLANKSDLLLPISMYTPVGTSTQVPAFIQPRNGSLINDKGTVYIISGGLRYGFSSEGVFKGMGFSFRNVYPGDTSFLVTGAPLNSFEQTHPDGTLINDRGTLYVMLNGTRSGFPSMEVLDSWGYWVTDAVPANSYDQKTSIGSIMSKRMVNQMNI